ncbi:alpha-N-acetylglucosaminidase [soil metagenome]
MPGEAPTTPTPPWADEVASLVARVIGRNAASRVTFELLDASASRSAAFAASGGELIIRARDGISASVAFHHYLRSACNRAVHWDTDLPLHIDTLPSAPHTELTARVDEQYMLNFCTFSYTMPYWGWDEWEREIDWMALHGITMPLAVTGHEAVMHAVLTSLGISSDRALSFLGSPSYIPFAYMGCLEGESPAMDLAWLERQRALGRRILERQRALGMTPVLPGFTGQIPRELAQDAATSRLWQGYETWVLDPEHPLFADLGAAIVREQVAQLGSDHLYASDPFIEMLPVESDPGYPARVASAILGAMLEGDSEARWVLQAWPFADKPDYWTQDQVRQFLSAIPSDRLIVLDLWAEASPQWIKFDAFSGTPWHWCGLLNFGGRSDPMGDLHGTARAVEEALASGHPPTGIGLAMEGTHNNHIYFEFITDLAWRAVPDVDAWVTDFALHRGAQDDDADSARAWRLLAETIYSASDVDLHPDVFRGVLTRRPTMVPSDAVELRIAAERLVWYPPQKLLDACNLFVAALFRTPELAGRALGKDAVDAAVAALCRVADVLYLRVLDSNGADREASSELLALFDTLDEILACRTDYRLSTWEASAVSAAGTVEQGQLFARASRQILTTWRPQPGHVLDDYAGRVWHGLVGDYYRARWTLWLEHAAAGFPPGERGTLERALDEVSARVINDGVRDRPRDGAELAALLRTGLDRFGSVFLTFDPAGRPAR